MTGCERGGVIAMHEHELRTERLPACCRKADLITITDKQTLV